MADSGAPTGPNRASSIKNDNSLKYAFDAGFLSGTSPPRDTPDTVEDEAGEESDQSSESAYSDSDTELRHGADLAASLRLFSDSMLRMELAELEMIKARETRRMEAEIRKMELETELTQMMLQNQLLIASFVSQKSSNRKRKRSDDVQSTPPERNGAILMSFLQCNLI